MLGCSPSHPRAAPRQPWIPRCDSGAPGRPKAERFRTCNHQAQQGGVSFARNDHKLAVGGNQLVTVYDIVSGGIIAKMQREGRVRCVALTSSGGIVVVGGFDRKATLHNIEAGAEINHFAADDVVRSVHLNSDSSRLAIGSDNKGKGCVCHLCHHGRRGKGSDPLAFLQICCGSW